MTQVVSPGNRTKGPFRLRILLRAAWLVCLALLLFGVQNWPSQEMWKAAFALERLSDVAWFFGFFSVGLLLRGQRWLRLLDVDLVLPYQIVLSVFAWCSFLSSFVPYRVGEAARPFWVKRLGGSLSLGVTSTVVERVYDLFVLSLFAGIFTAMSPQSPDWLNFLGFGYLAVLFGCGVLFILFSRPIYHWAETKAAAGTSKVLHQMVRVLHIMVYYCQWRRVTAQFLFTIVIWVMMTCAFHFLLTGFFPHLHWTVSLAVLLAVTFSAVVPTVPGNFGVFEASAIAVLLLYEFPPEQATIAAVALHVVLLLVILLTGFMGRLHMKMSPHVKMSLSGEDGGQAPKN